MPIRFKYILSILAVTGTALLACEKEAEPILTAEAPSGSAAFVKVVHAAPSFGSLFNTKDSFHVYVDAAKINGAFITYGGTYPSRAANGYAQVAAGSGTVRLFLPGLNKPDSVEIFSLTQNLQAGAYYSLIVTDSLRSASDANRIWVQDNITTPVDGQFSLRFVHAVMNDTAGTTVDVFSTRQAGVIATNVAPGQAGAFAAYPYVALSDTLVVRRSGTGQELARLNNVSFSNGRVYTLLYRGNANLAGTVPKARSLISYANK